MEADYSASTSCRVVLSFFIAFLLVSDWVTDEMVLQSDLVKDSSTLTLLCKEGLPRSGCGYVLNLSV